ncbi:hypothetical protein MMIC_P1948 [Mariprofundus micogutta]|uniref:DUF3616 domain-containing protein n=2 Tax=Mariprofundus micogutta TaxID=1921010 RepID=A0A1L8CPX0_9PROT|nr:hypothetical protein MMIC_P1948 [Mariprofundus micogutta]
MPHAETATTKAVSFHGNILADKDISAIAIFRGMLVIGSDEAVGNKSNKNYIQLLKQENPHAYRTVNDILIYRGNKLDGKELDIEAIAAEDQYLYVIGSHSLARKRLKKSNSYTDNRLRLSNIKHESSRNQLFRLTLNDSNQINSREQVSLSALFNSDPVLSRFTNIPSKENGIDIEGLATKNGLLYLGFRGPVLRDGYVPVMQLKFEKPELSYQLLYVALEGRGIRDIAAVSDGFLILAGPVGDEAVSFQLLHWNGKDCIPGGAGRMKLLSEITRPDSGKAEGLALLSETTEAYSLIMIFDGLRKGAPVHYTIKK